MPEENASIKLKTIENRGYVFQDRGRVLTQVSDKIFVDIRVPALVGQEDVAKRVAQVLDELKIRPARVEVVPYDWPPSGSRLHVAIACEVTDPAGMITHPNVHSYQARLSKPSSILVPF